MRLKTYIARTFSRYWPSGEGLILSLPGAESDPGPGSLPPELVEVALPDWARDLAPDGGTLPVPAFLAGGDWEKVDWFGAAFWYLNGSAERVFEERNGCAHSYSFRLRGFPARLWKRAWANRIALFLRRWAAHRAGGDENQLLGPLPRPEILVTHDLDAVSKTAAIRFKQAAFNLFNALRAAARGKILESCFRLVAVARFLFGRARYEQTRLMIEIEKRFGVRGVFFIYGGPGGWERKGLDLLFDPAYRVDGPAVMPVLERLRQHDLEIGLHGSFDSFADGRKLAEEKSRLERACGFAVAGGRQHWLRFGWKKTWSAQRGAGFLRDYTLGFNDRPGFRNGAAVWFNPVDPETGDPMDLAALPLVLMDSHVYDYAALSSEERGQRMADIVSEVRAVRGQACVLWHPHTLSADYGWNAGFVKLLELLRD